MQRASRARYHSLTKRSPSTAFTNVSAISAPAHPLPTSKLHQPNTQGQQPYSGDSPDHLKSARCVQPPIETRLMPCHGVLHPSSLILHTRPTAVLSEPGPSPARSHFTSPNFARQLLKRHDPYALGMFLGWKERKKERKERRRCARVRGWLAGWGGLRVRM